MKKLHLLASLIILPLMAVKTPKSARLILISDTSVPFPGDREEKGVLHRTAGPIRMKIATTHEGQMALANTELAQAARRERAKNARAQAVKNK